MKRPYNSLLCHGKDPHGLRQATLLGSVIYFQWNEPILRAICQKFLEQANALKEAEWQEQASEPLQTTEAPTVKQPVWNLDEYQNSSRNPKPEDERKNDRIRSENNPSRVTFVPHELIAWYCPAHYHKDSKIGEYGIHFDVAKVVGMAKAISEHAPEADRAKHSAEDWVLAAFVICIWHESCHSWVEDLCSLAESVTGRDYFTEATSRYGFYLVMEEALCNTAAYGMSRFFWDGGTNKPECLILLDAAKQWMRTQPLGYRDFSDKGWHWSPLNDGFLRNMRRLLLEIYEIPEVVAAHALRLYFPPQDTIFPDLQEWSGGDHTRDLANLATDQYIERYAYPTHTHPDLDANLTASYVGMRLEDRWSLLSFLRALDIEELAQRAKTTRNSEWRESAKMDCPFLGQLQEIVEFKSEDVKRFAEALIATALKLQEEDTVEPKPEWQEQVIQAISARIPRSNPKPDDFRPAAVFVPLPGAEDMDGRAASWEKRRERIREILEKGGIPFGSLEEINNFNHIRVHPPETEQSGWQKILLQALHRDLPRSDARADTHLSGTVFIPLPGLTWRNGERYLDVECKGRVEQYLMDRQIVFGHVEEVVGENGYRHLRIFPNETSASSKSLFDSEHAGAWQEQVIQAITSQIPGADPSPDSYHPTAVFVALPGEKDIDGITASWEKRCTRIRRILENADLPYGELKGINNFNHIQIHPPHMT